MRCVGLAISFAVFFSSPVFATMSVADEDAFLSALRQYGYDAPSTFGKTCEVEINLKQNEMVDKFEELQKLGIFNSDLPKSTSVTKPNVVTLAFLVQVAPIATKRIYDENSNADNCSFRQFVTVTDDYGKDQKILAFSYTFNRALYNKINWDQFQTSKVIKVFPSFRTAPKFAERLADEN